MAHPADGGFHYSREERLRSLHGGADGLLKRKRGFGRLFGGNKGAAFLGGFLLLFGALAGAAIVFTEKSSRGLLDKSFDFGSGRSVKARWIEAGERRGVNLLLDNASGETWNTGALRIHLDTLVLPQLESLSLAPGETRSAFIPAPAGISNLQGLRIQREK